MKAYRRLRLILGDQLNAHHSWYQQAQADTLYVIAELRQETDYAPHHVQKVSAFFSAMAQFAIALKQAGHQVLHLTLDDTGKFTDLSALLTSLSEQYQIQHIEYQQPDELRLATQLACLSVPCGALVSCVDTEHFLLPFDEIERYFAPQKHHRLEAFYRKMRKRFNVLMQGEQPVGEQWNFDQDNRQALKVKDLPNIPEPLCFATDVSEILNRLARHGVKTIGNAHTQLLWPTNRKQSLALLDHFCRYCLPNFGRFQDAMTANSPHQWSLYHSRLSFALNSKMLHPMQVIESAISAYEQSDGLINLAQIEGFVRQILGWREYVRGMYWANGEQYATLNTLNASADLPHWFWTANTKMNCMHQTIRQSLDYSYAHHIQRLMITGNFALLTGLNPDQVDAWYLGIYIDAIEWVEQPNTRGMALFADGGLIATKPYAASGNYIHKMSDYCKTCHYKVKLKTEHDACPFNALYWHFFDKHASRFERNPRMAFTYRSWHKQSDKQRQALLQKATELLSDLDSL
ncbi:cryptochrome/photolyase family protein [Echinimonas agarilytica]|uniref:Cryptochrome/photolyase family protein n=1 Tax=Echinimonas agarilytica TaxID=1215918 RepID=A0AA41W9B3_9GAMM|nr:cryptochrome/photolyase family protein [Echinimonas agarilytica]MCM2680987.1 cryptochrome/photolyase family protein [Echinimonas agarilytica]